MKVFNFCDHEWDVELLRRGPRDDSTFEYKCTLGDVVTNVVEISIICFRPSSGPWEVTDLPICLTPWMSGTFW